MGWDATAEDEEQDWIRDIVAECHGSTSKPHWNDRDPILESRRFPEPGSSILLARECVSVMFQLFSLSLSCTYSEFPWNPTMGTIP
jgi:hypothetical protein